MDPQPIFLIVAAELNTLPPSRAKHTAPSPQTIMVDPIPSEQWEQHKEEILRLYIDEDLPLRHVMKRVCTRDFHPEYGIVAVHDIPDTECVVASPNTARS